MIIKGKSRSGPAALAAHLGNAEKNERVEMLETRGTLADDLHGALAEMDAYALGTRCVKPLYHAALSPEPPHRLTAEQRVEAIDALEAKLGLSGHARVVVLHEKEGREHLHVVWSRIDLDQMRSISDSHNYRKHEEVSRELERRFEHDRVQGAHHEREGVTRPDRTPSRSELRQEERTGISGKQVKEDVTEAFRASDGVESFRTALADRGYILAQGDRRDFVIVDPGGGVHSLARRLDGMKAAELRAFMAPIDRESLPTIEAAQEQSLAQQAAFVRMQQSTADAVALDPAAPGQEAEPIPLVGGELGSVAIAERGAAGMADAIAQPVEKALEVLADFIGDLLAPPAPPSPEEIAAKIAAVEEAAKPKPLWEMSPEEYRLWRQDQEERQRAVDASQGIDPHEDAETRRHAREHPRERDRE